MTSHYHNEALRKSRILERIDRARERLAGEPDGRTQLLYLLDAPLLEQPRQTREEVHSNYKFREADHPVRHRRVDNTSTDQIFPIMKPQERSYTLPAEELPRRQIRVKI